MSPRGPRRLLAALVAVGGCAVSEEAFPEAVASAHCAQLQRCDPQVLDDLWDGDRGDCIDDQRGAVQLMVDVVRRVPGCTYDPAEAGRCVRAVRAASCDEESSGDSCDGVYDCGVWEGPS